MPSRDAAGRRRMVNRYLLVLAIVILAVLIAYLLGLLSGRRGTISGVKLRCVVSQNVTPFDDRVLYYDAGTLFCLSTSGSGADADSMKELLRLKASRRSILMTGSRNRSCL